MSQVERRGAIGVVRRDDGCYLVIERSATVRAPGRFCFPGGGIELGETEEQAVRRELREELNLEVEPVRQLWRSYTRSGVHLHWWLVELTSPANPVPNSREVARWFWMAPEEISRHPKTLLTNREFLAAVKSGKIDMTDGVG